MQTFQKPLSSAEEKKYLQMLKSNNPDEVRFAKNILVERNLRLVAHVAKKYQSPEEDAEELISIGCIGLIKAIDTFDCMRGRLSTYACRCIDNELLMMFRSRKKTSREMSIFEPLGRDNEGNDICFEDILEQEGEDVVDKLTRTNYLQMLPELIEGCLTDMEKEIIKMRYGINYDREYTQNEVGRKLNISRSYVSRLEKRSLEKLNKAFKGIINAE